MPRALVEWLQALILGVFVAGLIAGVVVPRLPQGDFTALVLVLALTCVGLAWLTLRYLRRRDGRRV